jgi:hypothetical protein
MHRLLLSIALGAALVSTAFAQTAAHPDLSGTWKLNSAKSKLDKHETITSETLVITCADSYVEFRYTIDGKDYPHRYITDGKERSIAEGGRQVSPYIITMVKAQWQKSVLVIEVMHRTLRWTLSSDGRTLTLDPDSNGKLSYVYDKQ